MLCDVSVRPTILKNIDISSGNCTGVCCVFSQGHVNCTLCHFCLKFTFCLLAYTASLPVFVLTIFFCINCPVLTCRFIHLSLFSVASLTRYLNTVAVSGPEIMTCLHTLHHTRFSQIFPNIPLPFGIISQETNILDVFFLFMVPCIVLTCACY
jgi:hypothetical protein